MDKDVDFLPEHPQIVAWSTSNFALEFLPEHPVFKLKVDDSIRVVCCAKCLESRPSFPSARVFSGKHLVLLDDHGQGQGGGTTERLSRPPNFRLVDKPAHESRAKSLVDLAMICSSTDMFSCPSFLASFMIAQGVEVFP